MEIYAYLYLIGSCIAWGMICANIDRESKFQSFKLQVMAISMSWFAVGIGFGHILKDIDDKHGKQ